MRAVNLTPSGATPTPDGLDELAGRALAATRMAARMRARSPVVTPEAWRRQGQPATGRVIARDSSAVAGRPCSERRHARRCLPRSDPPAGCRGSSQAPDPRTTADGARDVRPLSDAAVKPETDRSALDAALSAAQSATSRLKSSAMWPLPFLRRRLSSWRAVEAESRT